MYKIKIFLLLSVLFINILYADKAYVERPLLKKIGKKYKIYAKKRFFYLQETLNSVKNGTDLEKLDAVNTFYNDVRYMSDVKLYRKKDYWATPWEFLGKDKGDCEDYVISKYFALRYLKMPAKKLFFTYVRSTKFKAPHMVLTYFKTPRSEPLILDNNNRRVLKASIRKDLKPIYNFNGEVLKKASAKKKKSHKKWDQLKLNMKRKKI